MTPTREEFLFISAFGKHLFYALTYLSLAIAAAEIVLQLRVWMVGKPLRSHAEGLKSFIPTSETLSRWCRNIGSLVLGQKKVQGSRWKSGAPIHLMIFYGFVTLLLGTTLLAVNTYSPVKFHYGLYYLIYEMTLDVMGVVFLVGVAAAAIRRFVIEKRQAGGRVILSHLTSDYWALALLFIVGLTGYWLEAARMSAHPEPFDWSGPVGHLWSTLQGPISPLSYQVIWWFHMAWVWAFFILVPQMRLRHIVLVTLASAENPKTPMGYLSPISMEEVETTGKIGLSEASDLTRWDILTYDACMECGRCTEVCPAFGVGKALNPKLLAKGALHAAQNGLALAETLTEEAIWACTTCNACVEACPALVRHVDLVVGVRRNLVSEGKLAGTAATMLRQTAATENAWGASSSQREDWMKGLEVPLARDGKPFEYLFWVGCAGATDPGAMRTTKAVAQLLNKAGVSFACLGREEACTGDPARRVGDEFLFQEKASALAAIFLRYGVKKVVTACPHCMNTLKHEYQDFGAELEVFHHTQLLSNLVADRKLLPVTLDHQRVTFHDPCYLGRINNESDAPRKVFGEDSNLNDDRAALIAWVEQPPIPKGALLEPRNHGRKTLCCGAGGGRMWMDESPDQRPANRRAKELLETGAETIAVACPFCRIMLESGLSQESGGKAALVDVAEMMLEANPSA